MPSKNWEDIEELYKLQIQSDFEDGYKKFDGLHHVIALIPLLKSSEILSVAEPRTGLFTISFYTSDRKTWVTVVPPSPILTGDSTEFHIVRYGLDLDQNPVVLNERKIPCSSLDEIVKITENYFVQL